MTTIVTGANGFIGRAMISALVHQGIDVRIAVRQNSRRNLDSSTQHVSTHTISDIGPETDWTGALDGVQSVLHLAARVHVMNETASNPLVEFRHVNTLGTSRLASMAAQAGVRRMVYVSTIKVNGEATYGRAFHEDDPPQPSDSYAVSKWEAEQALQRISADTGMEIVIVRPPLVYGPGVGGNFLTMLNWIRRGVPLPLASIDNVRSLVGLDNLVSLLMTCLTHPNAAGERFLVSDRDDISTPELLRRTAKALDRTSCLLPFPVMILRMMAHLFAKNTACERLCGSLVVDSTKANQLLGWSPVSSMENELRRTADWYLGRASA